MALTADALNAACPYSTPQALAWLRDWAQQHPTGTVVLIGAGPGVMALALLEGSERINLTVVEKDTFRWMREHLAQSGRDWQGVNLWQGDSGVMGYDWEGGIDLLIVDGDHSEEGVLRDMAAWLGHVRAGGAVAFDDYYRTGDEWEGIRRAVNSFRWRGWHEPGGRSADPMRIFVQVP